MLKVIQGILNPIQSRGLRRVVGPLVVIFLYSLALVLWHQGYPDSGLKVPSGLHTFFGAVLGIVLVFRTNTAYDRWWEGRKLWGQLINDSRNFAIKLQTCVQAPLRERQEVAQWLIQFAVALRDHLRGNSRLQSLAGFETACEQPQHVPAYLSRCIYERIEQWRRSDNLGGFELLFIDRHAAALMEICGACERISKTPISPSYLKLVRQAVALYVLILPYSIVRELGVWTIFVALVVSYFMIGLELLAEAVENPFGSDDDDLRLDEMCRSIQRSVDEIMTPACGDGLNPR